MLQRIERHVQRKVRQSKKENRTKGRWTVEHAETPSDQKVEFKAKRSLDGRKVQTVG